MMKCRGMGAAMRKMGGKMVERKAYGKAVKRKAAGGTMPEAYNDPNYGKPQDFDPGGVERARMMAELERIAARKAAAQNRDMLADRGMRGGPRMAKGKTVKRKMKGKKV